MGIEKQRSVWTAIFWEHLGFKLQRRLSDNMKKPVPIPVLLLTVPKKERGTPWPTGKYQDLVRGQKGVRVGWGTTCEATADTTDRPYQKAC